MISIVFPTSKGENEAFPPPPTPSNVVSLYTIPVTDPTFDWGRGGEAQIVLFSEITHLRIVSQQFCHRLWVM